MECPGILGEGVTLNLVEIRFIVSSECNDRAFLLPQGKKHLGVGMFGSSMILPSGYILSSGRTVW